MRCIVEEVSIGIYNPAGTFPAGWCQDCSRVLGKLLEEQSEYGFKLVFGTRGEHSNSTHVWLKRGDLVVDITADQFCQKVASPVIVSTESSWHGEWQRTEQELDEFDAWRVERMLYKAIKSHLKWNLSS